MNVFYFHALKQRNTEHHDTIEQGPFWSGSGKEGKGHLTSTSGVLKDTHIHS
jgi:hypothetical protein